MQEIFASRQSPSAAEGAALRAADRQPQSKGQKANQWIARPAAD
jgi:hypothetical protein